MRSTGLVIAITIVCLGRAHADPAADAKVHIDRATELHARGNFGDAAAELELAYTLDPTPDVLFALGQVSVKVNRCGRAILYYKRFLGTHPASGPADAATEAIENCKGAAEPEPDHVAAASTAHAAGKLADAQSELVLAYTLDPKPDLLYALGQVHVQRGECTDAIVYYERFLAARPEGGPADQAKQAIETCKANPHGVVATATPAPLDLPKPPEPHERAPFYKDIVFDALVGGGVACAVLGGIEYKAALGKLDDADHAPTYPEQQALVDDAHSKRTVALALGAGGVALLGAGVVRFVLHGRAEAVGSVAVVPAARGSFVTWSRRF